MSEIEVRIAAEYGIATAQMARAMLRSIDADLSDEKLWNMAANAAAQFMDEIDYDRFKH